MHTNLGYMNRLQEIRVTNSDVRFPKRKHNNDFIWSKQFAPEEMKPTRNLSIYPSEPEVTNAWKEGVSMAQSLARELGMCDNNNDEGEETEDDDDKKWFFKPMEYVNLKDSLKAMITEKEQEDTRREAQGDDTESSDPNTVQDEQEDLRHVINPLLNQSEPEGRDSGREAE
jgi:hypothetical protein